MRVAWLAPYPVQLLEPSVRLARRQQAFHSCSWIVNLSRALAQRQDIELHILTESTLVPCNQVVESDGVVFHVLNTSLPLVNRGWPPWLPLDVLSGFHHNVKHQVKEIDTIKPDLVHAHGTERAYAMAGVASGRPCLVSMQGIVTEIHRLHPNLGSSFIRRMEQRTVKRARFFGCRTDFDTGFVRRFNSAARIFTLHEAMNPVYFDNEWKPNPSETIMFVGSFLRHKGLPFLLEAVALVKQRRPQVTLNIVGTNSPDRSSGFCQIWNRLNLNANVKFCGWQPAEEIARLHLESQVFVLPSQNENSPNALAEAMVSGMPVIATRVGGIPSLVQDGETGLLVPWGDPRALAEKIDWLLARPEERARLGQNARRIARARHAPDKVAAETVVAYKEILKATEDSHEYTRDSHWS
jgi:glycosyltransferase involved in cell wall biosynthesis